MSVLLPLRDYQKQTIDALVKTWALGDNRLAAVLPTGAGKTVVFSHLTSKFIETTTGRVLILAHTDELVSQAVKKLRAVAPSLRVGVVKAERNDVNAMAIVASVPTLRTAKRRNAIKNVGLIIVDECHHATAQTYRDILEHFGAFRAENPTLVAGFTATLARGDKANLSDIWQRVAYRKDIPFMIRSRYLVDVRGKRVEVDDLDLAAVRRSGGDYAVGDLGEAMEKSLAPEIVARAYAEHAGDRSGLLFAPTVSAAYHFAEELNKLGIKTETVHGALPDAERRGILERLDNGTTQVVSNCMVLTEGFDSPRVSCVVIARPTRSAPLYQQMVGRGLRVDPMRPYEDQDCLILDVVGASQVHGLASLIDLSEKKIVIREDQSLLEAVDEEQNDGCGERPKLVHRGPVKVLDFDPLASASKRVWRKTRAGHPYLTAGTRQVHGSVYVAIIPSTHPEADPGTYDVIWVSQDPRVPILGKCWDFTEHRGLNLALAMAWGEEVANDKRPFGTANTLAKSAPWRRKPVSDNQRHWCESRGIQVPADATAGDASDLIDAHNASRALDGGIKLILDNKITENKGATK